MYTLKIMAHTVSSLAMLSHTVAITNSRVARYVCDDNTFNIKDTYMFRDQTCLQTESQIQCQIVFKRIMYKMNIQKLLFESERNCLGIFLSTFDKKAPPIFIKLSAYVYFGVSYLLAFRYNQVHSLSGYLFQLCLNIRIPFNFKNDIEEHC